MIEKSEGYEWPGIDCQTYKNEPGTWVDVSRRVLFATPDSRFETRYFEIGPGGYTSYEEHGHEHCVVVLRGDGEAYLNGEWGTVSVGDVVHVTPHAPHQFRNRSKWPFGILCIVDKDRDRPNLLGNEPMSESS